MAESKLQQLHKALPKPKKEKEKPKKPSKAELRELSDKKLYNLGQHYPTDVDIIGEVNRRKNEKLKNRPTTIK